MKTGSDHNSSRNHSTDRRLLPLHGLLFACAACLSLLLCACATTLKPADTSTPEVQAEREKQRELAFSTFMQRQDRIYKISYPLLASAVALRPQAAEPVCGFMYHSKKFYGKESEDIAARYFGISEELTVRYAHPDFPAAAAGMQAGDRIVSVNGQPLTGKDPKEATQILTDNSPKVGAQMTVCIEREGRPMDLSVPGTPCLKYVILLQSNDTVNALADGSKVILTTGMVRMAETDEELAIVLAHEIAHNALGHRDKKTGNAVIGAVFDILVAATLGVNTHGAFSNMASGMFSKEFEAEADYAGLYIAARAGYDITNAANFWRRMAVEHPQSIGKNYASTHPSAPERFVAIEKAVAEIREKQQQGLPLLPEKKADKT